MKKSIVAICSDLDAGRYLDEWLAFHFGCGFDEATIYLNDVDPFVESELRYEWPDVRFIRFDGPVRQLQAYNDFLMNNDSDWAAFFDIDEFICTDDLDGLLSGFSDQFQLGLNWKLFGSSNIEKDDGRPVLDRFVYCQNGLNEHTKQIVNLKLCRENRLNPRFLNPHFTNIMSTDVFGRRYSGPFSHYNGYNGSLGRPKAYLAHYVIKSIEEFWTRRRGNRADTGTPRDRLDEFLKAHDVNEVFNDDLRKKAGYK